MRRRRGLRVGVGPPHEQHLAQLLHRAGFRLDGRTRDVRELDQIDTDQPFPEPRQLPVTRTLDERPQAARVGGGMQMDGGAQSHDTHELARVEERGQLGGIEVREARGESVVGRLDVLRLEADEMGHGILDRQIRGPAQEELPVEGGAIESTGSQDGARPARGRRVLHERNASGPCGHIRS